MELFSGKKTAQRRRAQHAGFARAAADIAPLEPAALPDADAATIAALTKDQVPEAKPAKFDDNVQAALDELDNSKPESEIAAALAKVKPASLRNRSWRHRQRPGV